MSVSILDIFFVINLIVYVDRPPKRKLLTNKNNSKKRRKVEEELDEPVDTGLSLMEDEELVLKLLNA